MPGPADSNGFILVKLQRKAEYRSNILSEPVRPNFVGSFSRFLKQQNHLCSDIDDNVIYMIAWENDKQLYWAVGYYSWTRLSFRCNK